MLFAGVSIQGREGRRSYAFVWRGVYVLTFAYIGSSRIEYLKINIWIYILC